MSQSKAPRIAAIVHTLNEEHNIADCLARVIGYADEVLVVDMYSDDRTAEIASEMGARVLMHERILEFDAARNWSAQQTDADWVYYVDADIRVPAELWPVLRDLLPRLDSSVGGVSLPYRNYFEGRWMTCLWPGYIAPVILRRGRFQWRQGVHEGCQVDGQVVFFPSDVPELAPEHYSFPDLQTYIRKSLVRYVPAEALKMERAGMRFDWRDALAGFGRDLAMYYDGSRSGRDGGEGLTWALLGGVYRLLSHLALYERQKNEFSMPADAAEILRAAMVGVEQVQRGLAHPARPETTAAARPPVSAQPTAGSPRVVWSAPLLDPSGYADEARSFVLGLDRLGVPLRASDLNWSDRRAVLSPEEDCALGRLLAAPAPPSGYVYVQHTFARSFQPDPAAVASVGRTMFETDRIPEDWVAACNRMDEVWVPSDFNVETFRRSGVDARRIRKVPGAIDRGRYEQPGPAYPLPNRRGFNFLSVFDWSLRKGWDVLIRAYLEAFGPDDDVCLYLKIHSTYGKPDRELLDELQSYVREKLGKDPASTARIVVLGGIFTDEQMLRLYRAVDAYVMPSRGEGWGRPLMDAMACGLPTIATAWGGNTEFMNPENSYLVDYELTDVPPEAVAEAPHFAGHRWAEPSATHTRALMRDVFDDREGARNRGARARAEVLARYDRPVIAALLAENLRRLLGKPVAATPVAWEGSQLVYHSLAHVNRELCLGLLRTGDVDLSIVSYEPNTFDASADPRLEEILARTGREGAPPAAVHVRHQWPPVFDPPQHGAWVMIQPWEYGGLPADWVPPMRDSVDEIWVPSTWVRDCYIRSGVPAEKVVVIPNGVDLSIYRPEGARYPLKTKKAFKFLFVGGTIARKGIDVLLNTYTRTFTATDDVCLVIKAVGAADAYADASIVDHLERLAQTRGAPEVEYIADSLSDTQMASLYRACDVLVHPYRGEGFGMPIAEAMASGVPAIVTGSGACLDFCDDDNAYLIPAREVPIEHLDGLPEASVGYWWAEPDANALLRLMRRAIDDRDERRVKAERARQRMQAFGWEGPTRLVLNRLTELATRRPVRLTRRPLAPIDRSPWPLDGRRSVAYLHRPRWSGTDWQDVVVGYARAFSADADVSLVLALDPAQGVSQREASERVGAALSAAGLDPDRTPDILLIPDDIGDADLERLYAAVDWVVSPADTEQLERARRSGARVLEGLTPSAWRRASRWTRAGARAVSRSAA